MNPFDIQVNGYAGADFCSPVLTAEQMHKACTEMVADGVDSILATVITDTMENLEAKLQNLVRLREADPVARDLIAGFHIEGPFLNAEPGYIGAHPPEAVKAANVDDAKRLLEATNGLTKLVTLAPENDPNFATTRFLAEQGITVSAGHCNPTLDQLGGAIDAGLSMVTHFGNGCPVDLPRHDNVLQRFLHFREQLWICFIPDGAHVEFFALKNYVDLIGLDRTIMVTDAIGAAKLGPGLHELSGLTVEVDKEGVARRPGYRNLAGSTITMPGVRQKLAEHLGLTEAGIRQVIRRKPANRYFWLSARFKTFRVIC